MGQFHLKSVPPRLDRIQVEALEDVPAIAAKSAGAVVDRDAEDNTGEDIAAAADQAGHRPVRRTPLGCSVTR